MNTTKIKEERSAFYLPNRGVELEDGGHIDYLSKEQSELSAGKNEVLLYAYFNDENRGGEFERMFIKIGMTGEGKTVDMRYNDQDIAQHHEKLVALWKVNKELSNGEALDKWVHHKLDKKIKEGRSYKHVKEKGTTENFEIFGFDSYRELIDDVEKILENKRELKSLSLYSDIVDLVGEIYNNSKKWNLLYLCPRWGKTRTSFSLCQLYNIENTRVTVLFSYVHTVKNSYFSDIYGIKEYNENFMFIDAENYNESDIISFLDENDDHHAIIYFRLTATSEKVKTYIANLTKLSKKYKMIGIVEEADFGAHCNTVNEENEYSSKLKIVHKVVNSCKLNKIFICSGTGFDKLTKFISKESSNDFEIFSRDYITDILAC